MRHLNLVWVAWFKLNIQINTCSELSEYLMRVNSVHFILQKSIIIFFFLYKLGKGNFSTFLFFWQFENNFCFRIIIIPKADLAKNENGDEEEEDWM